MNQSLPSHIPILDLLPLPRLAKTGWPWTEGTPLLPETMPDGAPWPRITVVTPSFNQGQFIEETIRSVLLQGYPNLEYLVVDGGSGDHTVEILEKYAPWLTDWVSEPDKGQSDAINKGFSRATGDMLAWLNSDDTYLPFALRDVALAFQRNPTADVVYSKTLQTDREGCPFRTVGEAFRLDILLNIQNVVAQPSAFMQRRCIEQVGMLNPNLHYTMDWEYWLRVALQGEIQFVDTVWSTYRSHQGTKTGNWPVTVEVELAKVYEDYLQNQHLPVHIGKRRALLLLQIYLLCAQRHLIYGPRLNAIRYGRLALEQVRAALLQPYSLVRLPRALLWPSLLMVKRTWPLF